MIHTAVTREAAIWY